LKPISPAPASLVCHPGFSHSPTRSRVNHS
jgi:hypothetical protein